MTIPYETYSKKIISYKNIVKVLYFQANNSKKTLKENKNKLFFDENGVIIDKETYYLSKSLARTKRNIKNIVLCTDWDYFITLTIDPKKYDSTVLDIAKKLIQYFERELRKHKCDYILIPEYHGDKSKLHFHGLVKGDLPIVDSGCVKIKEIKKPLRYETALKNGFDLTKAKKIFNVPNWKYGFASVIKVGESALDNEKLANYITKYITKDLLTIFNKHRYYCSKNVARPRVLIETSEVIFNGVPPVLNNYGELINEYHNDYCFVQLYEKPKNIDFAFDDENKVATFINSPF